jgi:protease-4
MRRTFSRQVSRLAVALAVGLVGALAAAGPARAQASDPEARPTRGVHLAGAARAGDADATAVQLNPAQLGFLPAGGLVLAIDGWRAATALPGRGVGLYTAMPTFCHGALGLGLSRVGATTAPFVESHTTLQLAYAQRLGRAASIGATWVHVWDSRFAGGDSLDVGLSLRAGRFLAAGLGLEDLVRPHPAGVATALPRLWAAELALRPLGTDRLELAVGAAHVEDDRWRRLAPRARLSARLTDGWHVFAVGESLPAAGSALGSGADTRVELGFALDLDHLGVTVAARGAFPAAGDDGGGVATLLRLDGARQAPLAGPDVVARVILDGPSGDRAYVELVRRLRALAFDANVVAVLLEIEDLELGLGRIEELRDVVASLRAHGKRVYAYGSFPSTREYYLASACDGIVLHPAGELSLNGLAQNVTFYKGALDRLGVTVDLVRIGEFKGAMEPFVMTAQSAPVRQNKQELLDDVFARFVAAVAAARSVPGCPLDEARVRQLVDRGLFTPAEARQAGLVDGVADHDELEAWLRQALGRPRVAVRDLDGSPGREAAWPSRRVAVLLVDGAIVDGGSQRLPFEGGALAGSDTLVKALERCREDASVGAVVLRVNSPGGSAFASDVIARAVQKVRKAGKPVVVSMGDVAASGGYYIAAPADAIFAEPSTVSGSIGIFAYKVDVQKLLSTLGLAVETMRRGQHADYLSPYRPWTDEERQLTADKIRHFYDLFVATVVDGRRPHAQGLTPARVDELGRGHVWTGAQAQRLGLVDQLGGVGAAIDLAARLGHVPLGHDQQPELVLLPPAIASPLQRLAGLAQVEGADGDGQGRPTLDAALAKLGGASALRLLAPFLFSNASNIQARLPYDLELR